MGYLSQIKGALGSRQYRDFAVQKTGRSMGYLAILTLIIGLPVLLFYANQMTTGTSDLIKEFSQGCPDFKLENGQLQVFAEMPLNLGDNELPIIIDTTGQTDASIVNQYNEIILFTQDQYIQKQGLQTKITNFSDLKGFTITKAMVESWLPMFKWLAVIMVLVGLPGIFLFKLIEALLFALVALILGAIFKVSLNYAKALNICIYALTLPFIVQALQKVFWPEFPHPSLLFYALLITYLIVGVRANIPTIPFISDIPVEHPASSTDSPDLPVE